MKALWYFLSSCRVFKFQQASSSSLTRFGFTHYAIPFRHKIRPIRAIRFDAIGRRRLLFHKSRRIIAGRGWRSREGDAGGVGLLAKGFCFEFELRWFFFYFFFWIRRKLRYNFEVSFSHWVNRWRSSGGRPGGGLGVVGGVLTHTHAYTPAHGAALGTSWYLFIAVGSARFFL